MKYDPEFSEFYLMGRKVALQNIQNGRHAYSIVDFTREFPHVKVKSIGDEKWEAFAKGALEVYNEHINSISDKDVNGFINELKELLQKYPNISIQMGCGCCGGAYWSNGQFTRDFGDRIDAIETV